MLHYDMARERINTHLTCCGAGGKEVRKKCLDDLRSKISQESLKKNL